MSADLRTGEESNWLINCRTSEAKSRAGRKENLSEALEVNHKYLWEAPESKGLHNFLFPIARRAEPSIFCS